MIIPGEFYRVDGRAWVVRSITCFSHGAVGGARMVLVPFEDTIAAGTPAKMELRCKHCDNPVRVILRPATATEAALARNAGEREPSVPEGTE